MNGQRTTMAILSANNEKSSLNFDKATTLTGNFLFYFNSKLANENNYFFFNLGYGLFNIIILLSAGLCLMVVIIETMGMMFVIPAAQCDLDLTLDQKSLLSAISFLGVVSSSLLWGFLADTRGRKNVLFVSMVTSFATTFVASFVPQSWLFIFLRFLNGFW